MPSDSGLAIFDICGTLYRANTTAGFIAFVARRERRRGAALLIASVLSRRSPLRYALHIVGRLASRDIGRAVLLRTLRSMPVERMDVLAASYVADELSRLRIAPVHAKLAEARARGDRIVLISNSIDPVVRAIARHFGVEQASSRLEIVAGRATGRLADDLTGIKHRLIDELRAGPGERLTVVSDNASDAELLAMADRPVIVRHGGKDHRSLAKLDAEIVDVVD